MDIVERLRGIYRAPITDGLGAAGGDEPDNPHEFVRKFETPPIQHDAADEIERLRKALRLAGDRVARLAYKMPPPNAWTPQFVLLGLTIARAALKENE